MNIGAKAFAARVKLPCRLFCGGEDGLEVSGTAVSIDTGSAVLAIPDGTQLHPKLGEVVHLELQLPANAVSAAARCLAVRARVAQVVEMRDGTRQMTVQFRKAAFKDSEKPLRKPPKGAAKAWEM
jgi:hypothetical protein